MEQYDASRQSFLLNAAVAFGDACTRPKLTPTCPYYEESEAGPTCGDQCRGVAKSLGDNSRKISQHKMGGLVLTGREIPLSAAAGVEGFDASRLYIAERHLPVREQSTSALLLGLRHHSINIVLSESHPDQQSIPLEIWSELDRRDFPTSRAAAAGLSMPLARAAVSRATFGRLATSGLIGSVGVGEPSEHDPWAAFLTTVLGRLSPLSMDSVRPRAGSGAGPRLILPGWLSDLDRDGSVSAVIASDDVLRVAFSPDFVYRLSQWFGRLLADDPDRVFRASVPDQHLFLGLDRSPYSDDTGDWLWTRLTQTALDGWSQSALVHEWNWQARDESHGIHRRVLRERIIEPDIVSRACLERLSSSTAELRGAGFDPAHFVQRAIDLLKGGDAQGAANIFSGLTELRPTDALAWNNLGFCQVAFDPLAALRSFGKSAMFSRDGIPIQIRIVNQVLALHLLGLDSDALILASEISGLPTERGSVWLWNHPAPEQAGAPVPVDNVRSYFEELVLHIENGHCAPGTGPTDKSP